MRSHRSFAQLRHARDLGMLEMFDQKKPGHDALHLRQRLDGGVDSACQLVADGRQISAIATSRRMGIGQLLMPAALPVLENVECEIRHDSIDPWTERLSR